MDPDVRVLLKKNLELAEENNRMLRSMRRNGRIMSIIHVLYWIVILGLALWSYQTIQPYLEQALKTYQSLQTTQHNVELKVQSIPDFFKKLLPDFGSSTASSSLK